MMHYIFVDIVLSYHYIQFANQVEDIAHIEEDLYRIENHINQSNLDQ
jgi:hypothetical protein